MPRHAAVHVDLDAITANVAALAELARPAEMCVVVKANGYGHGAVEVARAAVAAGADWLAVALVEEGVELRDGGLDVPILVLSEPPADAMNDALASALTPAVYTEEGIDAAAAAAIAVHGRAAGSSVHLKIDTGMHRAGAQPADALVLAQRIRSSGLDLGGTFTHLAVADEPDRPETQVQLDRFGAVLARLSSAGVDAGRCHAVNSAGLITRPSARMDLVRVGIAVYGLSPNPALPVPVTLRPALSLRSEVTLVKDVAEGEGVSYGLRHVFDRDATVATVPLGYADGVPRCLGTEGGEVLIGGVRRPIRGVVTMDQFVVEVTAGPPVRREDQVVLIGCQGDDEITAHEWAEWAGTISYEIVSRFGPAIAEGPPSHGRDTMIWEVPGVSVGHWSDPVARTGCSVVLFDRAPVASGEVRGGAPATHEFSLLEPFATVERIDAVVLTGGSAYGLAATHGVMSWCEEQGRGFPTAVGPVPLVVGLGLFDLPVGDSSVRPGPEQGRSACDSSGSRELGLVGAGCGTTVGKWRGADAALPGGLLGAVAHDGDLVVAALVAVNSWGDVHGYGAHGSPWPRITEPAGEEGSSFGNTTIGVVATNANLDKMDCHHLARAAHDGLARAITPPHARADGDAFVAVATGAVAAPPELVRALAVETMEAALRSLGAPSR